MEIKGVYEGKDQKTFGKYALVFFNNFQKKNMNAFSYTDAFIILHAIHNKMSCYGDPVVDSAEHLEIDSDLTAELRDTAIKDVRVDGISVLRDQIAEIDLKQYDDKIDALKEQHNYDVDRKKIVVDGSKIKEVGNYTAMVNIYKEIKAEINLEIVAE